MPAVWRELIPLLSAGDYLAATKRATELVKEDPLSIEAARCLALAQSAGAPTAAMETWRRVLYLSPADPGAHFALGIILLNTGKRSEARAHFRSVVKLLKEKADTDRMPGPDTLPVGWVRSACRSLAGESEGSFR